MRCTLPLTSVQLCPDTPLKDAYLLVHCNSSVTQLRLQFQRSPYWAEAPTPPPLEHSRSLVALACWHGRCWPGLQQLVLANAAREDLEALAALPPWPQLHSVRVEGFGACSYREDAARLAALGRALARWPALERLTLVLVDPSLLTGLVLSAAAVQAVACDVAPCCKQLKVFQVLLPPGSLAVSWMGREREFGQPDEGEAAAAFTALAAATFHWPGLQRLTVPNVCLSTAAIDQLAQHAPQLQALRLERCSTGGSEAEVALVAQALAHAVSVWAPQLQVLWLTGNDNSALLRSPAGSVLGRALAGCTALKDLQLPKVWGCKAVFAPLLAQPQPALQRVVVWPCRGISVVNAAHHLPSLRHLRLVTNDDNGVGAALQHLPELRHFMVRGGSAASEAVVQALAAACPRLEQLELEYGSVRTLSLAPLAKAAHAWPGLRALRLLGRVDRLGAGSDAHLAAAIGCWPQLQVLSVCPGNPWLTPGGGAGLWPAAAGALPGQLQRLVLRGAQMSANSADSLACCRALARRVLQPPHMTCLTCLSIEGLALGNRGAYALAAALAGMPQLRTLRAFKCSIAAAGGASLMSAIGFHCPHLCELDLEHNNALGDAAVQVFQPLHPPFQLEYLNLGSCGLTAVAFKALCSQDWPRLRVLVLDHNGGLGQRAARELGCAGQRFPALNILSLEGTGIDAFPPPEHAHHWPMLWDGWCFADSSDGSDASDGDASDSSDGDGSD